MRNNSGNGKKTVPNVTEHLIDPAKNYWPTGLIPFDPTNRGLSRFTSGILDYLEHGSKERLDDRARRTLKPHYRKKIEQTLKEAKTRRLEINSINLDQIEIAYNTIVDESIKEFHQAFAEKYPDISLPAHIQKAFNSEAIRTTEDLTKYMNENENVLFASLIRSEESLTLHRKRREFHSLVRLFQERFDNANERMLSLLLFPRKDENVKHTENRLQRRMDEAVAFLKKVTDKVREYQVKKGHKTVLLLDIPSDLTHKRIFDLAEILFYKGTYRIGKERRYFAQLILYFTQLFYFIHEDPDYLNAPETARRLQNLLNFYATDATEGRKGSEIRHVFMDHRGNMSEKQDEVFNRRVMGLYKLKFSPRLVSSVLEKQNIENETVVTIFDGEERTLFPDGFSFLIRSRCKSPESLVLKYLKKGGSFNHKNIQDRVAFEFVIDEKDLCDTFVTKHNREPSPDEQRELLSHAVSDLQLYLCDVWHVKNFQEEDDLLTEKERENAVSSKRFKVNKMIFAKEVRSIIMPIEVQIQTLTTKLMNESPDDDAAHRNYEDKRVIETNVLNYVFPPEIFPEIGLIPQGFTQDLEAAFAEESASNG